MGPGVGRGNEDEQELGFASISVGSEDLTGVTIVGTRGTTIRGQIVLEPPPASTGPKASAFSVFPIAKDPDAPMLFMPGMFREHLDDDWSFEVRVAHSPVLLRTGMTANGYSLKSVIVNGNDVTDTGIAFKQGETVTGVQVVLTTRSGQISGSVTDDKGRPAPDYVVALFAEDRAKWGFMSRYVQMARPDQAGAFQAKNLPPGSYLAIAVESLEDGQMGDPELLERLRPLATAFTLNDGEQKSLALKIVQAY
jgi:hypothetical protein